MLAIAPSWLQEYQVEDKTGWWTDWGIGRVSPSPVSPGSLPPSHQEIHRLCLLRWLHQGPWQRKEGPFRIVVFIVLILLGNWKKIYNSWKLYITQNNKLLMPKNDQWSTPPHKNNISMWSNNIISQFCNWANLRLITTLWRQSTAIDYWLVGSLN